MVKQNDGLNGSALHISDSKVRASLVNSVAVCVLLLDDFYSGCVIRDDCLFNELQLARLGQ